MSDISNKHIKDVTFTEESLLAFISKIRNSIKDNLMFVSTSDMAKKKAEAAPNEPNFTFAEREIDEVFTDDDDNDDDWETKHAAQICIINNEIKKIIKTKNNENNEEVEDLGNNDDNRSSGRYTWIQGGSLLNFKTELNGYNENNRPNGTIYINENNGTKTHIVQVKGFDTNGNLSISSETDASRFTLEINDPAAGDGNENATVSGSINTLGGIAARKSIKGYKVHGAVFNDYAEYRHTEQIEPGRCVIETGKGDLILSDKRLQLGGNIISDTYGFSIGETYYANTPIAVCGRVLAYTFEHRELFKPGEAVCSGPNGTISRMTREEIRNWPDAIIGYVSEIPDYEEWGSDKVKVDGRIWIKVK